MGITIRQICAIDPLITNETNETTYALKKLCLVFPPIILFIYAVGGGFQMEKPSRYLIVVFCLKSKKMYLPSVQPRCYQVKSHFTDGGTPDSNAYCQACFDLQGNGDLLDIL